MLPSHVYIFKKEPLQGKYVYLKQSLFVAKNTDGTHTIDTV